MAETGYYILEEQSPRGWQLAGLWYFDGQQLEPVTNDLSLSTFSVQPGESLEDAVENQIRKWHQQIIPFRVVATKLKPGEYYRRVARPTLNRDGLGHIMLPNRHDLQNEISASQGYFRTLIELLERILLVVYPEKHTLSTYGHEIRNLLILACTECEAQWRSVLSANGYSAAKDYKTGDFVHLADVMRLREYAVKFTRYPWLDDFRPYEDWNVQSPTKSISWYYAYNASKHDRISNMRVSTLHNAMMAMSACWITLIGQFGGPVMGDQQDFREYFTLCGSPNWSCNEAYIFGVTEKHHCPSHPINYPF